MYHLINCFINSIWSKIDLQTATVFFTSGVPGVSGGGEVMDLRPVGVRGKESEVDPDRGGVGGVPPSTV